ncbi:T9SS type A sorting domain-containing protein [Halpernia frigidisoli]|uniref:Por secretion system C-terminal sorting domain-containing protein n=1 Tax=Halpernia frigidisoli TaxID=1125876 RepID=A0A1I3F7T3_9FLAO|nr:T9SS type A sorting domain-containing protein [Halpernia frigidisoli]SFI07220.1 Por secretion system C-terminal sorting domain-containing protein [Halpernia frigidisoli]
MKKIFTILSLIALTGVATAQTTFTALYDFNEAPNTDFGDQTAGTTNLFSISGFTASTALTPTTTANRFAWTNPSLDATIDTSKYFEVTITPSSGNSLSISSITFRAQRSSTGPRNFVVRSSADSYAANLPASVDANPNLEIQTPNQFFFVIDQSGGESGCKITPSALTNIKTPITFRFYFYAAEAATGTFSVDDVLISGTTVSNLAVSDVNKSKSALVKNTNVSNTISFAAKTDVQILNMTGQVVKSASVTESTPLNVSSLSKGIYIVTGVVDGQKVSQKIIKN